jgi:sugar lactone lactonase YvrE
MRIQPAASDPKRALGAIACTVHQATLGEGARWDDRRHELLRVDILAGSVHRDSVDDDGGLHSVRVYEVPGTVGAVAPIEGDDGWLLAAGRGFSHLSPDAKLRPVAETAPIGTRMNDGACDPQGRFWAGSMADDHRPGGGALHRLGATGRTTTVLDDLTIPNGLGWRPDGATMYLVDSGPRIVHAFEFDGAQGTISGGTALITVPDDVGAPDGLTVDAAGDLWVAIYGGGRINRYAPDGSLRAVLPVPTEQTTSCAFGGAEMNRLYVTTGTEGWSDERRRSEPAAGLVYRIDTNAIGRPAMRFIPDADWWRTITGRGLD